MSKIRTAVSTDDTSDDSRPEKDGELALDVETSVFIDTVYTSRTLILPCGRAVPVAKGRVTAMDKPLLDYLTEHQDFQPVEG